MSLVVQKYGGTSVGTLEAIARVADRVKKTCEQGHQVIVVLSAMNGETDRLLELAKGVSDKPHPRELDALLATGEQVSVALLSIALRDLNCDAQSFSGGQAGIKTNTVHSKARILGVEVDTLKSSLDAGKIPVVCGFQGVNQHGDIATLGRGGSDTTAVALAAALKASECQIYTDVDGVYTSDPRVVERAKRLNRVTFEEMLELASLGAKVLQIRAVEFAGKYNVPLRVLSSFVDGSGTLISFEDSRMEQPLVSGIAFDRNQAKLSMVGTPDRPGIAQEIFGCISDANIEVDMIVQNTSVQGELIDFSFTVQRDDYAQALELLEGLAKKLGSQAVFGDECVAKLSIVGVGMRSHAGVAANMFKALGEENINIQLISTSEIKVSVLVDEKYLELGARTLHTAFGLDT